MGSPLPGSFIVAVLSLPGLVFFVFSLWEIRDEKQFKKQATITTGIVVKALSAKFGARQYDYNAGTASTSGSSGGHLLIVEYTTSNGDTYHAKTKQNFTSIPDELEVRYSPNNPVDLMIDGYYKSAGSKYYRLIAGAFFGIVPILALLFWCLFA